MENGCLLSVLRVGLFLGLLKEADPAVGEVTARGVICYSAVHCRAQAILCSWWDTIPLSSLCISALIIVTIPKITRISNHFSVANTKFRLWILWLLAYFQVSLLLVHWRHRVSWRTSNCSHNDKTPCMRSRRALARCFALRFTPCSWYNPASLELERKASFENIKSQRCTTQGELLPCTWLKSGR